MSEPYRRYRCRFCAHVYDEAQGDPDTGGTRFADIPDDWMCPECGAGKSDYEPA